MIIVLYLIIGLIAGMFSGLMGIGGGVIIVPLLTEAFQWIHFPESRVMQSAVATSLAIMLFTTAGAAYSHYRQGGFKKELFYQFLPGLLVGVVWGAIMAHKISSLDLQVLFACLILFIAFRLWFVKAKNQLKKPSKVNMALTSLGIGGVSGLFGIGGGILSVPYFMHCKLSSNQAVALGVLFSFIAALVGTITWWFLSIYAPIVGPHVDWGYINWEAVIPAGMAGVLIAPLGVRLSKRWSILYLRRSLALILFALFLQKMTTWLMVVFQ